MNEWKKVKLGDCCLKIGSGSTPKGGSTVYVDSGTSLIRSQNVYNLLFDYNGLTHITDEAAKKLKGVTIFNEDILLNITGDSVARTCVVPNDVLPARVNQHVAIVRVDKNLMNYRFLNYYLASPKMQAHMLNLAVGKGASRNAMTKQMIENFEVPCPPLPTQHRIATILSRYDSLIENYQKQIKLLEEAAQRLYKEWFVDLRFPGYESTKIVDGVPEGWEKKKLGEIILKSIGGGWGKDYPQEKFDKEGFVIRGTDISKLKYGNLDEIPFRFHTESNLKERTLCDGDIIFEVSGGSDKDPVGRMYFMTKPILDYYKKDVICASFCKKISFPNKLVSLLCFYAMQYCRNSGDMKKYEKDSAGNIINFAWTTFLENFHMLVPNENFLKNFYKIANANINQQVNISLQIRLLTEARDRLLPKLMRGGIL